MSISEKLIKSPHRGKWNGEDLILNKDRVNDFGEVLTPPNIVSDMLDLISKEYGEKLGQAEGTLPIDKTFLEPSVGTGNFVVQILQRKLRNCHSDEDIFNSVASIYGVDIQKDNVLETRLRLLEEIEAIKPDEKFLSLIAEVLEKNIIGGDTLSDKRGCSVDNVWLKGSVMNATGTIEDDGISHDRLIAYKWSWGSPVTKTVEFLIEKDEEKVVESVKVDMNNLADKFKNLF